MLTSYLEAPESESNPLPRRSTKTLHPLLLPFPLLSFGRGAASLLRLYTGGHNDLLEKGEQEYNCISSALGKPFHQGYSGAKLRIRSIAAELKPHQDRYAR